MDGWLRSRRALCLGILPESRWSIRHPYEGFSVDFLALKGRFTRAVSPTSFRRAGTLRSRTSPALDQGQLQEFFGLTRTEAALAGALVERLSLVEFEATRGTGLETVRTQKRHFPFRAPTLGADHDGAAWVGKLALAPRQRGCPSMLHTSPSRLGFLSNTYLSPFMVALPLMRLRAFLALISLLASTSCGDSASDSAPPSDSDRPDEEDGPEPPDETPDDEDDITGAGGTTASPEGGAGGVSAAGAGNVSEPAERCLENQHVVAGYCATCPMGTTAKAGHDPEGSDTDCQAIRCGEDERVESHTCVPCDEGAFNAAGDLASNGNTSCEAVLCSKDQHVVANSCVQCPAGTANDEGDDATQGGTQCVAFSCGENERVESGSCVACLPGTTNQPGDDATQGDTSCEAVFCHNNEHVANHACVPCLAGSTNVAGDNASGGDTSCDPTLCGEDERVAAHSCASCPAGSTNVAGDNAVGGNTSCDATLCGEDQRVASHVCVPCLAGMTRTAGDNASMGDTMCDVVYCAADERVQSHHCVPCSAGTTNESGDNATHSNTACTPLFCDEDERVANHHCIACPPGATNPSGDDARLDDTSCRARSLYYTEWGTSSIKRFDLGGVETRIASASFPYGLAADPAQNRLYYESNHEIFQADLNGGGATKLGAVDNSLGMTAGLNGNLFVSSYNDDEITLFSGGSSSVILSVANPSGLAYDFTTDKLFYITYNDPAVYRVNPNGTSPEVIVPSLIGEGFGLAVHGGHVYYSTRRSIIYRCNLDGSNNIALISGQGVVEGLTLDPQSGKLFWIDTDAQMLRMAELSNGTNIVDVHPVARFSGHMIYLERDAP